MEKISLDQLFISTEKQDKPLNMVIKNQIKKFYEKDKISDDELKIIGGSFLSLPKSIKICENETYTYPYPIICNSCNNKRNIKMTENLPGIECFYSSTSKSTPINIKVKCRICNNTKNSYINSSTLPADMQKKINLKLKKA